MIVAYPRLCAACNRSYSSKSAFSTHKKRCHLYAAQLEVDNMRKDAAMEKIIATLPDTPLTMRTTIVQEKEMATPDPRQLVVELQDELVSVKRELECLKLKHEISQRKVPIGYSTGDSIYLAQTRDCFDKDNNVFKIGRTTNYEQRKKGYPKGTIFYLQRLCLSAPTMERTILAKADTLYKKRTDYGNEYFEGDLRSMIDLINTEVNAESSKD